MEQLTMKLETILEVVRVKQEVMERPVEYRTGMISSSYAGNFGIKEIGDEASEVVLVVVLNMKNEINAIHRVFTGSLNTSVAHPREIFRTAIINNGAKIMLFHNHPSGDPTPSREDIEVTERLAESGRILGIELLDSLINGLYPEEHLESFISLRPAMTFKTKPVYLKTVKANEPISYGCTYAPKEKALIATMPIGYADGLSRSLSNKGYVTIKQKRAPIVGRVCMDQSMIDVSHIENVTIDDIITIFGDPKEGYISIGEVAKIMNTIHYETSCLIGKRVPRVYIENGEVISQKSMLIQDCNLLNGKEVVV